jgi:hypothetical protein
VAFSSFISNCFDALSAAVVSAIQTLLILFKTWTPDWTWMFPIGKEAEFL